MQRVDNPPRLEYTPITTSSIGHIEAPAWRPDGKVAVFAAGWGSNYDIMAVDPDNPSTLESIVAGKAHETHPAWSPDGKRLAFASTAFGNWDIFVVDMDTRDVTRVTSDPANDAVPEWFDDELLMFTSDRSGQSEIWEMPVTGGPPRQVTEDGPNEFCAVSPDRKRVAWIKHNSQLAIANLESSEALLAPLPRNCAYKPTWSPDGRFVAVTSSGWGSTDIYLVKSDASRAMLLTKSWDPGRRVDLDQHPVWSPDGNSILFVSDRDGFDALYRITNLKPFMERLEAEENIDVFEFFSGDIPDLADIFTSDTTRTRP